jgi:hypothetical protein
MVNKMSKTKIVGLAAAIAIGASFCFSSPLEGLDRTVNQSTIYIPVAAIQYVYPTATPWSDVGEPPVPNTPTAVPTQTMTATPVPTVLTTYTLSPIYK